MTDLTVKVPVPLMLTATDLQHHLQISRSEAYALIARGDVPSVRIGKLVRVPRAALLDLVNSTAATANS